MIKINIIRQEMDDKRYGVPIHLVEQLKQISLKRKAERMSFIGYCETKFGVVDAISIWRNIQAQNRYISINPFPYLPDGLHRYLLPQQTLINLDDRTVRITLEDGLPFIIIFPDNNTKEHFVTALGDLNVTPSSSPSGSSSSSSDQSESLSNSDQSESSRVTAAGNFERET